MMTHGPKSWGSDQRLIQDLFTNSLSLLPPGIFIFLASLVGLIGLACKHRPSFSIYQRMIQIGLVAAVLVAVWPTHIATGDKSYCVLVKDQCMEVSAPVACPYGPNPFYSSFRKLEGKGEKVHPIMAMTCYFLSMLLYLLNVIIAYLLADDASSPSSENRRLRDNRSLQGVGASCCYDEDFTMFCR